MAEEKKTPVKSEEGKVSKIKNLPSIIAKPFKNMVAELRKVTWPSKKKLISSCITVLLFMLFVGVVVGVLDMGTRAAVDAAAGVNVSTTDTASATEDGAESAEAGEEADHVHDDAAGETEE